MKSADAVAGLAVTIIAGAGLVAIVTRSARLRGGRAVRGKEAWTMDTSTRVGMASIGLTLAAVAAMGLWKGVVRRSLRMRDGRTATGAEAVAIGLVVAAVSGFPAFALLAAVVADVIGGP